jgi:hypothetical protein
MQNQAKSMEELFRQLPGESQQEVRDFIEFLIAKQQARSRRQPQFDWAGTLADLRDRYSSVDLQHQITSWRSDPE